MLQPILLTGRLSQLNMSNRYISTSLEDYPVISVNNSAQIANANVEVHNGIIHVITDVLQPTEQNVVEVIATFSKYSLFTEAIKATGIANKLNLIEDKLYDNNPLSYDIVLGYNNGNPETLPSFRKYGYTLFVEPDSVFEANGITDIRALIAYAKAEYDAVYPKDAGLYDSDLKHPKNPLNRFVAYHCVNKQMSRSKLMDDYFSTDHTIKSLEFDLYEYIEPMCPNTLIEVRSLRAEGRRNLINLY